VWPADFEILGPLRDVQIIAVIHDAELHWYEAHGVGKVQWKIKR
jgi:hypothetical protein